MIAQVDREYVQVAGVRATARRALSYLFFEGRPATTRGQWFNPIVNANLSLAVRRPLGQPLDRPIFILGVGRSGTTHLGRLLSAHASVGWLNEPKMIWHRILPDEDVSGFYAPWGKFALEPADATSDVSMRAHRLFGHYLKTLGATRLVDKYPELTYRIPFLRQLFPDARILAIVRRPEDFVNSVEDWNRSHAAGDQDWWGVRRSKWLRLCEQLVDADPEVLRAHRSVSHLSIAEMAATEWALGMRALLKHSGNIDAFVRYENLAAEPADVVESILESCGLEPSPEVLALAKRTTSSKLRTQAADFGALEQVIHSTRLQLGV